MELAHPTIGRPLESLNGAEGIRLCPFPLTPRDLPFALINLLDTIGTKSIGGKGAGTTTTTTSTIIVSTEGEGDEKEEENGTHEEFPHGFPAIM